jgi:outer membrane lipase/esterase
MMSTIKQCTLIYALLMITTLSMPCSVRAAGFNQYIGFGDSTLDSGYWRYNTAGIPAYDALTAAAVAYGDSGAYNGNGVENSIMLANKFGVSAAPVGAPGGGTNYANGASYTLNSGPFPMSVPTVQQIKNYLSSVKGTANPHALYVIKSGDNDLNYSPLPPNFLSDAASSMATQSLVLQTAGAHTIMVPNSYSSAVYAGLGGDIDPSNAAKYKTSVEYFSLRWADLQAAGVHFIPGDIDGLFKFVVHNPTLFGFTSSSVLSANAPALINPFPYNHALWAYPLTPTQQQAFLFVDTVHMTTAGQTLMADHEYSLLVAPSQVSLVVESAVQNGLAIASTIQRQIDLCTDLSEQPSRTRGANLWLTVAPQYLRVKNAQGFPEACGVPFSGTLGVDIWLDCQALLGLAFTAGGQEQKFSKIGGHFNQIALAPTLYAAYKYKRVWGEVATTYSAFLNTIKRRVPLGIFNDENRAHSHGSSLALMVYVGGDFKPGHITTGPVASMVLQRARLNGLTETGNSGVTALSFASQTRNSFISQLGWRILGDVGKWQPFAHIRWNHEWGDKKNKVTASLTSVVAPSYTMAAAPVASDWSDIWLGTVYLINSQVSLRGSFLGTFFNRRLENYGGELGLNVNF